MHDHDFFLLENRDDVVIARFQDDRLLDTVAIEQLGQALHDLVEAEGHQRIVLNFAKVKFLSSATINKIIVLLGKARSAGGGVHCCELRPNLRDVFRFTRLDRDLPVFDHEADAVKAFLDHPGTPPSRSTAG